MAKKVTVRDIAKAAGVSVATVSRVLNSQSGFSPETERLVQETAGRMGYRIPERKAQSRETEAIALVIPAVNEYFSGSLTRSVENAARKRGYVVILCNAGCDAMYGEEFVGLLKKKLVKGIVACSIPPDSALLRVIWEAKLPCVLIDSVSYEYTFPYVKIDDFQGMYAATKFLLDRGHRRIAILSGAMEDQVAGGPRMEGYRQALRDAGIAPSAQLEAFAGDFSYESGRKAFMELLSREADFTGLVTCSDVVAAAAITAAAKRGIRVPQELSVIGFDNSQIAALLNPPLTSAAQPYQEMGEMAVHLLKKVIEYEGLMESRVFPVHIVERETTAPPPEK